MSRPAAVADQSSRGADPSRRRRLRVVYVFRAPAPGAYSIEGLFDSIAQAMHEHCEVTRVVLRRGLGMVADALALRRARPDVVHVTGGANHVLPWLIGMNVVLTVHDIGHYLYTLGGWRRALYRILWMELPYRSAARITTISRYTAGMLTRHFPFTARKISVVHNCVAPAFRPVIHRFDAIRPTLLQVGTHPHKNLARVIEAIRGTGWRLEILGALDEGSCRALDVAGIDYGSHSALGADQVHALYARADIVLFVSLGEGFGMPIIEAQATGTPVVTSNIAAMPEVAGEGACLVDPTDVEAIRAAMRRIVEDATYREALVRRGHENVRRFRPDAVAADYYAVYEALR